MLKLALLVFAWGTFAFNPHKSDQSSILASDHNSLSELNSKLQDKPIDWYSSVKGEWTILCNGYAGQLSIWKNITSGKYEGAIRYDSNVLPWGNSGQFEPITELDVDWAYWGLYISFYRPSAKQRYYGISNAALGLLFSVNNQVFSHTISGHFIQEGSTVSWPFNGQRAVQNGPADQGGVYSTLQNGFACFLTLPNSITLTLSGTGILQCYNDIYVSNSLGSSENIKIQLLSKYNGWYIYFERPNVKQKYYGLFSFHPNTNSISGHFIQGDDPTPYEFDASKRKSSQFGPVFPLHGEKGSNAILSHEHVGGLAFYSGLLPSGKIKLNQNIWDFWPGITEDITSKKIILNGANGHYYFKFTRLNGDIYYGIVDDGQSDNHGFLHGHYIDKNGIHYPWDGLIDTTLEII